MAYYRISPSRVIRIVRYPARTEEGIAPDTVAFMQPVSYKTKNGVRSWTQEYWVMAVTQRTSSKLKVKSNKLRIISAWRYPGVTKPGATLPIEIKREIREALSGM